MPEKDAFLPVKMTCFNVGTAFDENGPEPRSSSGTRRRNIPKESIALTDGENRIPLQPTLLIQYASSRSL